MHFLSFWKGWSAPYRLVWYILATIFVISVIFMWVGYFSGPSGVINWEKIQEQKAIEATIDAFRLGPFQITIPAESYVILEHFAGSDVTHNFVATYLFLFVFAVAIIALLTISTTLDTIWYLVATTIFIVLFVTLRLEALILFGQKGMVIPFSILGAFLLASFYFKYYRPDTPFTTRLIVFTGLTAIVWGLTFFASGVTYPFMHLLVTAYPAALILSVYFIIVVAHEILVSFVYLSSRQGSGREGAKHFSFLGLIYLFYIVLTTLNEIGAIDWNLIYFNIYLLLTISAVLGVWGYRLREPQYENIFPFHPYGAFFFLALGALCFSTIGQFLGNWNDAALKVVRDLIIFSHAGFGIIFFMYFLSNFIGMMSKDIPVYHLLYKPNRMPFFTFRFTGLIVTLAFVFYSQWTEYVYHGEGGYYNYVADLYNLQGDERMAMVFYDQSRARAFQSNRANYALAKIRSSRLDVERAHTNYELANGRRPTEYSLTNAGNLYFWTTDYFDAIREFKKGRKVMPRSAVLANNLGYGYIRIHRLDSAIYFLDEARGTDLTKSSGEANFLAMAALEYIPVNADSILTIFDSDETVVTANAIALSTLFDQKLSEVKDPIDGKPLDLYSVTYLNNYIIRNVDKLDTAWIRKAYALSTDPANVDYREAIKAPLAFAYYHKGQVYKALEILGELAYIAQNYQGTFNYTMGLWALQQQDPTLAASYFLYADDANFKKAKFYRAIALTESGELGQAIVAWDSLRVRESDPAIRTLSERILKILNTPVSKLNTLTDAEKYQFCRYRLGVRDTVMLNSIVESFESPNYKGQALLDISQKLYDADRLIPAIQYLNKTSGLQLTDKVLFDNIRHHELLMLASRGEIRLVAAQINKGVEFDDKRQLEKMLYTAIISEASADVKTAEPYYKYLAHANPFFEDGILAAAKYYQRKDSTSLKPYEILTESIYLNARSIRLVKAYAAEAARQGFDTYAASAQETLAKLENELR